MEMRVLSGTFIIASIDDDACVSLHLRIATHIDIVLLRLPIESSGSVMTMLFDGTF